MESEVPEYWYWTSIAVYPQRVQRFLRMVKSCEERKRLSRATKNRCWLSLYRPSTPLDLSTTCLALAICLHSAIWSPSAHSLYQLRPWPFWSCLNPRLPEIPFEIDHTGPPYRNPPDILLQTYHSPYTTLVGIHWSYLHHSLPYSSTYRVFLVCRLPKTTTSESKLLAPVHLQCFFDCLIS